MFWRTPWKLACQIKMEGLFATGKATALIAASKPTYTPLELSNHRLVFTIPSLDSIYWGWLVYNNTIGDALSCIVGLPRTNNLVISIDVIGHIKPTWISETRVWIYLGGLIGPRVRTMAERIAYDRQAHDHFLEKFPRK